MIRHRRSSVGESRSALTAAVTATLATIGVLAIVASLLGSDVASAGQVGAADFNGPTGITTCGSHVWVTNVSGDSVTEFEASSGARDQIISSALNIFSEPTGIAANGTDLWVTNLSSDSVAELNCATGTSVRGITAGSLSNPVAVAIGHAKVWVASQAHQSDSTGDVIPNSSSVTAYAATSGALAENVEGSSANGLNGSSGIAVGGGNVWIANSTGNTVTELNGRNGQVVRRVDGPFKWPMGYRLDRRRHLGRQSLWKLPHRN